MSAPGWLAALGARALGQQQALRLAPTSGWLDEADEVPTAWPSGAAALPGEAAPADPPQAARAGGPVSAMATPPEVNGLEPERPQPLPRSQAQPQPALGDAAAARTPIPESPRISLPATVQAPLNQVAVPEQAVGLSTRLASLDPKLVAAALPRAQEAQSWPEPLLPPWTPSPLPEPQAGPGDKAPAPPAPIEVQVHIGRVEFVATPPPAPTPARRSAPQRSLAEYLQGGGGGRR